MPDARSLHHCVKNKQLKLNACSGKGPAYSASSLKSDKRVLALKPFLLGVKTSCFKRKLCYIKSTNVPSYNSIIGAIFEYDINQE